MGNRICVKGQILLSALLLAYTASAQIPTAYKRAVGSSAGQLYLARACTCLLLLATRGVQHGLQMGGKSCSQCMEAHGECLSKGLAAAYFAEDDPVGPVSKGRLEEIPDRDGRQPVLRLPSFEPDKVVLAHVNFRGVLDEENTFIGGDEFSEGI